jgi:hypothetical protein
MDMRNRDNTMELQKRVYVVGTVSDTGNEIALIKTKKLANQNGNQSNVRT